MRGQPQRRRRDAPVPRPPDADRPGQARPGSHPRPGGRDAARHDHRRTLQRRGPFGRDARRGAARTDPLARRARVRRLMHNDGVRVAVPQGGPEVRLLDARSAGLDEPALRAAARALTDATGTPSVTRSYRYPYARVSWHSGQAGIDIERIERCDPAFAASICTPAETVEWWSLSNPHEYFIALWSSKEALANALDYDPRRLQGPMLWPDGQAGVWRAAQLPVTDDHVAWVSWRSAG